MLDSVINVSALLNTYNIYSKLKPILEPHLYLLYINLKNFLLEEKTEMLTEIAIVFIGYNDHAAFAGSLERYLTQRGIQGIIFSIYCSMLDRRWQDALIQWNGTPVM